MMLDAPKASTRDAPLSLAGLAAPAALRAGDYLGGPALAGTAFDHSPRILADLIEGSGGNVLVA